MVRDRGVLTVCVLLQPGGWAAWRRFAFCSVTKLFHVETSGQHSSRKDELLNLTEIFIQL